MKLLASVVRMIFIAAVLAVSPVSAVAESGASLQHAEVLMSQGKYAEAIRYIDQQSDGSAPAQILSAEALSALGMDNQALEVLVGTLQSVQQSDVTPAHLALLYGRIGNAHRAMADYEQALAHLLKGLELADDHGLDHTRTGLLNDLATVYAEQGELTLAVTHFRASVQAARSVRDSGAEALAGVNLTRALIQQGSAASLEAVLNETHRATLSMLPSVAKLNNLIPLGDLTHQAQVQFHLPQDWRVRAHDVLSRALSLADELEDDRAASYALGHLGTLYEHEQEYEDALELSRTAAFRAQAADAREALYLWQWQVGRILVAQDDVEGGLRAYRSSLGTLTSIRASLVTGSGSTFKERVGPIYFELADLLLSRTATLQDAQAIRDSLIEARDILEQLKTAEILDYFGNDCVLQDEDETELDRLSRRAAIVYSVTLPDRVELLVKLPEDLLQYTVPVDSEDLTTTVRRFRLAIERVTVGDEYLGDAQVLYEWLVKPMLPALERSGVDTLVFVLDGALRTVPMGALHDGQAFLVERFALAITPGMSLTNPQPIESKSARILANGLTEAVQGFSALPNVASELENIASLYDASVNRDEAFQLQTVERSMAQGKYSIVHIATHGTFDSDHRKSFLLAYDDKFTMNRLEQSLGMRRYQEEALELLVLSACQTAAGDDRAALGMAGIALKAGARSALATLWFINDQSTSTLMTDFYRNLLDTGNSKAQALRLAQLKMIANQEHAHPAHWAPFLLIGNWL